MMEQDNPEDLNEVEIANLLKKVFKVMIVKIIKELRRKMDNQSKKLEVCGGFCLLLNLLQYCFYFVFLFFGC